MQFIHIVNLHYSSNPFYKFADSVKLSEMKSRPRGTLVVLVEKQKFPAPNPRGSSWAAFLFQRPDCEQRSFSQSIYGHRFALLCSLLMMSLFNVASTPAAAEPTSAAAQRRLNAPDADMGVRRAPSGSSDSAVGQAHR